jgi:phenylalanyl-tRNA synthetase beta chain
MKISFKWLKDYVTLEQPAIELAKRLTLAGIEPKEVKIIGGEWENIFVGHVESVAQHPNADRLHLVTVDLGTEKPTVVCGAPNVAAGQKIAFGKVGTKVRDPQTGKIEVLKPARIRGVESAGMCMSERELGISDNHEGIIVLPEDAPVGKPLAEYLGDVILDLEVTPNRPDCLSTIGIAREFAALTGQQIKLEEPAYPENGDPIEGQVSIDIQSPDLCPRYCASLIKNVKLGESPKWMQERLIACGMRPINNVVDITNYVMLEYGQPLHSFDYTALSGKKIIVRRAAPGEKIMSLDNIDRELTNDMLVIADERRPVAIAGVMGGANSEVIEQTTMVLLESASFKATSIHYTARSLHLLSEASMRFERGIRADLTLPALKRATQLLVELCGGEAAKGIIDVYPGKQELPSISLQVEKCRSLLGIDFGYQQIVNTLKLLGFKTGESDTESEITVEVPYWRSDVKLPVDLVEEVARITGYDKIPLTLLAEEIPHADPNPAFSLKRKINSSLTGFGFQNIVTLSLVGAEILNKLSPEKQPYLPAPVRLANPMTAEQEVLRPTLRANLLAALAANRRFEEGGIRLYELSRVYLAQEKGLPDERETVCGVLCGLRGDRTCHGANETVDFYDAKGVVEALLEKLGAAAVFEPSSDAGLHPNKQAAIVLAGNRAGVIGELHPKVAQNFEINEPVYLFEIDVKSLLPAIGERAYHPLPKFPAVVRDIALIVDIEITNNKILDVIKGFSLVKQAEIFDIYTGEQVPPGKKSLAYRLTLLSPDRTLKEQEVNGVMKGILSKLAKETGATLRG